MRTEVISALVKIHAASLKPFHEFLQMAELEDLAKEKKMDSKDLYYSLLGYSSPKGFSYSQVGELRQLAASYRYDEIVNLYGLSEKSEINKLLGNAKAVPSIVKKGSIPPEIFNEVRVVASHLLYEGSYYLSYNGQFVPLREIIKSIDLTQKGIEDFGDSLSDFYCNSFSISENDKVIFRNFVLYTPNYEELKDRLKEIVYWSLMSIIVPVNYMPMNLAIYFVKTHRAYFFDPFKKHYLDLLDYLHFNNVPVSEILFSLGLAHPDIVTNYQRTGAISLKLEEDLFTVMNFNSAVRLSRSEFESCLSRDLLNKLTTKNQKVVVQIGEGYVPLAEVGGL